MYFAFSLDCHRQILPKPTLANLQQSERNIDGYFEVKQSQFFRCFVGWLELSSLQLHWDKRSLLP